MKHARKAIAAATLAAALVGLSGSASASCAAATRFSGVWRGNDGGTYQMGESGGRVSWIGRSGDGGRTFTNRFSGTRRGNIVTGNWLDVPPGVIRNRGMLTLQLANGTITRLSATGGFGGSRWTKPCNDVVLNPVHD